MNSQEEVAPSAAIGNDDVPIEAPAVNNDAIGTNDDPMLLGVPLSAIESQLRTMIETSCGHGVGVLRTRPTPSSDRPPYTWLLHRQPRDAEQSGQVCFACGKAHAGRVSSYRIQLYARDGAVHYFCEQEKKSVRIGAIAIPSAPTGTAGTQRSRSSKRKRATGNWSHDGDYDWLGQPLAPKANKVEQMAQLRERVYSDERDEIMDAIRVRWPNAVLVEQNSTENNNQDASGGVQNNETNEPSLASLRDSLQFRINGDSGAVRTARIDRCDGTVSVDSDGTMSVDDNNGGEQQIVVHHLYKEYFALDDAQPTERIDIDCASAFSVAQCRKAFHVARLTVNCMVRAQRLGVEYMNRFFAAVRGESKYVAKDFESTGVPSGVRWPREKKCVMRGDLSRAAMLEKNTPDVWTLDWQCLAALVSTDGVSNAAPTIDIAASVKVCSAMRVWLDSGLHRSYARRQFQPLPPRGLRGLHRYIDEKFYASQRDVDDELLWYEHNVRDYEDVACIGGYRVLATVRLYHDYCVHVARNDEIWPEWLGFYAHFRQLPFENCHQVPAMFCVRGSGKTSSVEWISKCASKKHALMDAKASTCLGRFNQPVQYQTFIFFDEFDGPTLGAEGWKNFLTLATGEQIAIEAKHVNPTQTRNCSHIVIASDKPDAMSPHRGGNGGGIGELANAAGAGQRLRRPIVCDTDASLLDWDGISGGEARCEAYYTRLNGRYGSFHCGLGYSAMANLYDSIDLEELPFNPIKNAKSTKAREQQMERALSFVAKFVMRILNGSIGTPSKHARHLPSNAGYETPFWTDDEDGSEITEVEKTWVRPVSNDDFFATYKEVMLSESTSTTLTRDDFSEQMKDYLPPRYDTTHRKKDTKEQTKKSGEACVVISRSSTVFTDGTDKKDRPRMQEWPKWSICCAKFSQKTGIRIAHWRAGKEGEEGEKEEDEKKEDKKEEDEGQKYGRFCDDVLRLTKPMRADPTLFRPDALCQQLCTYFGVEMAVGWYSGAHIEHVLYVAHAIATTVDQFAPPQEVISDTKLPELRDYTPERAFEKASVPPIERVPAPVRRLVQEFADQRGVDVAMLLLPDGVWATVNSKATVASAERQQAESAMIFQRGSSRYSVARGNSRSSNSALPPPTASMSRIEQVMQTALRVAEQLVQPIDVVLRRRSQGRGDTGPVVCLALWGQLDQNASESTLFVKPLVRVEDLRAVQQQDEEVVVEEEEEEKEKEEEEDENESASEL